MSLLEESSYEEEGESPILDSNIKRKQGTVNTANNLDQQGISSSQKSRQGGKDQDDSKRNNNTAKIDNETTERGRSTGKTQTKTKQSFGRHFGSLPHQKSITLASINKPKRKKNNSLMKNFCFFSDNSNHEQLMKQMYDESLVEWRKFQNSRINEPKKMQTKETMNGAAKSLQMSVGGQKKFTLKDLQKIKKDQEEEDKEVKSIGMAVRRKSCCCSQCGQLNSQQLQLVDVPFVPTQHKKFFDIKYRIKTILAAPIRPPIRSNNASGGTVIIQKSSPAGGFTESGFSNSPRAVNGNNSMHKIVAGFEISNINISLNSNNNNNNINQTISSNSSRPSIKPTKPDNFGFISATSNTSIEKNSNDENINFSSKQNQVVKFKERSSQREASIFNSAVMIPIPQMAGSNKQIGSNIQNTNNSGFQKTLVFQPFNDSIKYEIKRPNHNSYKKNLQQQPENILERSLKERSREMRALNNVLHNIKEQSNTPRGETSSVSNIVRNESYTKSKGDNIHDQNYYGKGKQSSNHSKEGSENEFNNNNESTQLKMESLTQFRDRYIRQFQEHPITLRGQSQEKRQNRDNSGFSLPRTAKHSNNLHSFHFHGEKYEKREENPNGIEKLIVFSDSKSPVLQSPYFIELKGEEFLFEQHFNKKNAYQRVFSPSFPDELQFEIPSPSHPETLNQQRNSKGNKNNISNSNNPVNPAYFSLSHRKRNFSSSELFSGEHKEAAQTARSAKFSCYYKPFKNIKSNNIQGNSKNNQGQKQHQQEQSQHGSHIQGQQIGQNSGQNTLSNLPALENNPKRISYSNSQLNKNNQGNGKIQDIVDQHNNNSLKGMEQQQSSAVKSFGQLSNLKGSNENSLYNTKSFKELDSLLYDNNIRLNQQDSKHSSRNFNKVQLKPQKIKEIQQGNGSQDKNIVGFYNLKSEK